MAILEKNLLKIRIKSYWRNTVFFSHCAFSTELYQRIFTMGLIIWYSWWFSFMSYRPYNICWNLCNLWRFRLHFHYNRFILSRTKTHIGQAFYFHEKHVGLIQYLIAFGEFIFLTFLIALKRSDQLAFSF